MPNDAGTTSRRDELLDACYDYVVERGLSGLSLRPLAAATGTSPRVLLFLFGSKEALVRELLARARREQQALVAAALDPQDGNGNDDFDQLVSRLWATLSASEQRPMVRLTYEAFLQSLSHDPGPWTGFAAESAQDWLNLLIAAQRSTPRKQAEVRATKELALVRGLLLDLLACDDPERVGLAAPTMARQRRTKRLPPDTAR